MLETSARRALQKLGWKVSRIEHDGYLATKGEETLPFDDVDALELFIAQERRNLATDLRDGTRKAQLVEVSGSGATFTRVAQTAPIKFICAHCGQEFEQERYPSRRAAAGLLYHSEECAQEAQREKTRERVARHRAGKKHAQ